MAVFTGQDGVLVFNGQTQVRVRNWSFTSNVDTLETTDLGDGARSYRAGLKTATATCTIMYHDDNSTLQSILATAVNTTTPTSHRLELRWDDKDLDFNAFITSVNVTCSVGEVMTADLSFQMTGDYLDIDL
jgi:hypothetical protein|tara:strand:- start:11934 stop:12326 length:393 start_codon:yes stop_codon:yes gene_type:complete